ncbi:hypothetical protein [Flammeovirga agarivorans]|uniref:hypothetical protein n=1 Tax=Flammeovirga agarivorans TaxID=2726742 RepID=UPI001456A512|nr:hypothetical protein [Flammeovirga agarivorans]
MKPVKIIDYSLVVISMCYSSYVMFLFLSEHTSFLPSLLISVFIVFLSHHYTYQSIIYYKATKSLNQYIILSLSLTAFVFYSEWNGQFVHAKESIGIASTVEIETQIKNIEATIQRSSNHTIKGKTNWALYQTFLDSQKQLKTAEQKREQLLIQQQEDLTEANILANQFRCFSVILFLLAFLASSIETKSRKSINVENENQLLTLNEVDKKKSKIIELIKEGEISNIKMLVDYFNLPEEEAFFLLQNFKPSQQKIGF